MHAYTNLPLTHTRACTHTHTHILARAHTQWVANALVPTLGIVSMSYTGTTHPPAAACATVYILDSTGLETLKANLRVFFQPHSPT